MQPTQYALQPTRYAQCTLIAPENVQLGKLPINSFCASVWGFPRSGTSTISANFPKPLGHAVGHRGLERLMYPSEIAIGEMERHRTRMVFHLFAEKSVWRPRHAASVREIHPRPIEARQACSTASDGEVHRPRRQRMVIFGVAFVDYFLAHDGNAF